MLDGREHGGIITADGRQVHFFYHQALLVRLVTVAVIVVFGPMLCMLLIAGFRLTKSSAQRIGQDMRPRQGHLP